MILPFSRNHLGPEFKGSRWNAAKPSFGTIFEFLLLRH